MPPDVSDYLLRPTSEPYKPALRAHLEKLYRRRAVLTAASVESPQVGAELGEVLAAIELGEGELRILERRERAALPIAAAKLGPVFWFVLYEAVTALGVVTVAAVLGWALAQ
jgi:hypothetical protein